MCGIYGIVNTALSDFDKTAFEVLGIDNDSRGGDSCGIFIDGLYEYGVKDLKLFSNFFKTSEVLKKTSKCIVAFGHDRKASVGPINEQAAQPVVITKNGIIEYVLMHNGTIYNYKELAKKYIPKVDIKGFTDSQVMAHIFYHAGYDVLSEYIGAGVFAIIDYRKKNTQVLFFKGASKLDEYSKKASDERPFYYTEQNGQVMFSSIPTYLKVFHQDSELWTLPTNTLCIFKKGKLYVKKEYSRDNCTQKPKYNAGTAMTYYDGYGWREYDDYYGNYNNRIAGSNSTKNNTYTKSYIRCDTDFIFSIDNKRLHGEYEITSYGSIIEDPIYNSRKFYFWCGILLHNGECFDALQQICDEFGIFPEDIVCSFPEFTQMLALTPVYDESTQKYIIGDGPYSSHPANGSYKIPFSIKVATFTDGKFSSLKYDNSQILLDVLEYYDRLSKTPIDIMSLLNQLYNEDDIRN